MPGLRGRHTRRPVRNCKRIFCVAVVAAAGLAGLISPVAAATTASLASLYLTPSTGSPNVGDELDVQIRVNTGAQFTNAVQANFTYPSSQLSVVGFDNSASSFPVVAQQQASNGLIQVAGGAFTPVSGDTNLTTIRFQVIGTGTLHVCPAGQARPNFDSISPASPALARLGAGHGCGVGVALGAG